METAKTQASQEQKAQVERGERYATIYCGNNECRTPSTENEKRLERCAKCQDAYYCSRECQVAHWPEHKSRCKLVAKALQSAATTALRYMARRQAAEYLGATANFKALLREWSERRSCDGK